MGDNFWIGKPCPKPHELPLVEAVETAESRADVAERVAERVEARYLTRLQAYVCLITLLVVFATSGITGLVWLNVRIAVNEIRISALEEKAKGYDALITQRNQQYADFAGRLGRIEGTLENIEKHLK